MDTRPTDRLIYGCMGLGGSWETGTYDAGDVAVAEAAVQAALEIGITTFDHADIYRRGTSEAVFGEVLSRSPGLRSRIRIQTKSGIRLGGEHGPGIYDLRGTSIRQRLHESLERLRTDHVDALLLHRPDPLADPAEIGEVLTSLHREGLVRAFGVSNMSAAQIAALRAHTDLPVVANQLEMGLHRRDWLEVGVLVNTAAATQVGFPDGTLEYCRAEGIQLQAWGALANGRFTGAPREDGDDAVAELVLGLAEAKGTTPEAVVLWWLQRHPAGVVPVIGTSRADRIRACRDAAAGEPRLTHDEWYALWLAARGAPLP